MTVERNDAMVNALASDFINCWIPIAQSTLTGSVASVTFSSIPNTFRTLILITQIRTDRAFEKDVISMRFNADSGNNYDRHRTIFTNATAFSQLLAQTSLTQIMTCAGNTARASSFSPGIIEIPGYKKTDKEKFCLARNCTYGDISVTTDLEYVLSSGRWRNTNAITSITFFAIGNFVSGSIFSLYGIL